MKHCAHHFFSSLITLAIIDCVVLPVVVFVSDGDVDGGVAYFSRLLCYCFHFFLLCVGMVFIADRAWYCIVVLSGILNQHWREKPFKFCKWDWIWFFVPNRISCIEYTNYRPFIHDSFVFSFSYFFHCIASFTPTIERQLISAQIDFRICIQIGGHVMPFASL